MHLVLLPPNNVKFKMEKYSEMAPGRNDGNIVIARFYILCMGKKIIKNHLQLQHPHT